MTTVLPLLTSYPNPLPRPPQVVTLCVMAEDDKPKYLKASDPETWDKPDDISWGDYSFNPNKPLTARQREACRLAAEGWPQFKIAKELKYTDAHLSRIVNSTKGRNQIERYQDKSYEESVAKRVKNLGSPAIDVFEEILTSDDPAVKPNLKLDAAKWVAEKISGKAKQEVEFSGSVAVGVLDRIDEMKKSGQIIDVTQSASKQEVETTEELSEEQKSRKKIDSFFDDDL